MYDDFEGVDVGLSNVSSSIRSSGDGVDDGDGLF